MAIISAATAYRQSIANDSTTRVTDWWTTASNVVATAINEAVEQGKQHAYAKLSYAAYSDIDRELFQKHVADALVTDDEISYEVEFDVPGPLPTDTWFYVRISYHKCATPATDSGDADTEEP